MRSNFNQNFLKLVALLSMTVDHIGSILFGSQDSFGTNFGRLAMPLFILLLTYNFAFNTKVPIRYLQRIFGWGLVSQPIFWFAFNKPGLLNILVTLGLLGTILTVFGDRLRHSEIWYYIVSLILLLLFLVFNSTGLSFQFEYGFIALFLGITFFGLLCHRSVEYCLYLFVGLYFLNGTAAQFMAVVVYLSLILLISTRVRVELEFIRKYKQLFYAYYPLHLLALVLIRTCFF